MPFFVLEGKHARVIVEARTAGEARRNRAAMYRAIGPAAENAPGFLEAAENLTVMSIMPARDIGDAVFDDDRTKGNFLWTASLLEGTPSPTTDVTSGTIGTDGVKTTVILPSTLEENINNAISGAVAAGIPAEGIADIVAQIYNLEISPDEWEIPPETIVLLKDSTGNLIVDDIGAPSLHPVSAALLKMMVDAQAIRGEVAVAENQQGWGQNLDRAGQEAIAALQFAPDYSSEEVIAQLLAKYEGERGLAETEGIYKQLAAEALATATIRVGESTAWGVVEAARLTGTTEEAVASTYAGRDITVAGIQKDEAFGVQDRISQGEIDLFDRESKFLLSPEQQLLKSAIEASPQVLAQIQSLLGDPARLGAISAAGGLGAVDRLIQQFGPFGLLDRSQQTAAPPSPATATSQVDPATAIPQHAGLVPLPMYGGVDPAELEYAFGTSDYRPGPYREDLIGQEILTPKPEPGTAPSVGTLPPQVDPATATPSYDSILGAHNTVTGPNNYIPAAYSTPWYDATIGLSGAPLSDSHEWGPRYRTASQLLPALPGETVPARRSVKPHDSRGFLI